MKLRKLTLNLDQLMQAGHGLEALATLSGVRYTTGQREAASAIDLILSKLGPER